MATGFFGKLPSYGDFIKQRLPRAFIDCWDDWVRRSIACSLEQLGEETWEDRYLVTPIWRFFWSARVCGATPWVGLFMPSVDSGGRSYPMVVACPLAEGTDPRAAIEGGEAWFARLEEILLSGLEDDVNLEEFDRLVAGQDLRLPAGPVDDPDPAPGGADRLRVGGEGSNTRGALSTLAWRQVLAMPAGFSIWWTAAETGGEYLVQLFVGLPEDSAFVRFLAPEGFPRESSPAQASPTESSPAESSPAGSLPAESPRAESSPAEAEPLRQTPEA